MGRAADNVLSTPRWLTRRVALWQHRAGLDDWQIVVVFKQSVRKNGSWCKATTEWAAGYRAATMTFAKGHYDGMSAREVDALICHELFHLISARCDDTMQEYIGSESRVNHVFVKEMESVADHFAILLTRAYRRKRES